MSAASQTCMSLSEGRRDPVHVLQSASKLGYHVASAETLGYRMDAIRQQGDKITLADTLIRRGVKPLHVHDLIHRRLFSVSARIWMAIRVQLHDAQDWDAEWLLAECLGRCRNQQQVEQCYAEYQANPGRGTQWLEVLLCQPSLEFVRDTFQQLWDFQAGRKGQEPLTQRPHPLAL